MTDLPPAIRSTGWQLHHDNCGYYAVNPLTGGKMLKRHPTPEPVIALLCDLFCRPRLWMGQFGAAPLVDTASCSNAGDEFVKNP